MTIEVKKSIQRDDVSELPPLVSEITSGIWSDQQCQKN